MLPSSVWQHTTQGIRDVLRYAGKAWVFERGLASTEEIRDYWEDGVPIWNVSAGSVCIVARTCPPRLR